MKTIVIFIMLDIVIHLFIIQLAKDMGKREERKEKEFYDDYMNNGGFERDVNIIGRMRFDDWEDIDEKGGKK